MLVKVGARPKPGVGTPPGLPGGWQRPEQTEPSPAPSQGVHQQEALNPGSPLWMWASQVASESLCQILSHLPF